MPAEVIPMTQASLPIDRCQHQHTTGLTHREAMQVGYSGLLGLGMPSVLAGRASAKSNGLTGAAPKQVLIVFLTGAASHHETFDMKPQAPAEVRGEFKPTSTSVPGLHVSEHLPELAKRAHQYAIVRSLSHGDNNHLMSTHYVLTGDLQPGGFFDKVASRTDWPCYSAACAYLRPRDDGIPSGTQSRPLSNFSCTPCTRSRFTSGFVEQRWLPYPVRLPLISAKYSGLSLK